MEIIVGKKLPFKEDIKKIHQRWKFWETSVRVDEDYIFDKDALGNPIIKRFHCEEQRNYKERLVRSSPRNLISNILNQYNGAIFRESPERDERIMEFASNADARGSSLSSIERDALTRAMIYGISPILIESQTGGRLSLAQAREAGETTRVISVDPWSLVNWEIRDGFLLTILISFVDEEGNYFARLYDDTTITDVFYDDKQMVTSVGETIPHGFSQIPVVLVDLNITNFSFVQPLAQIQMSINNILSLLRQEEYTQTFTRWVLSGIDSFANMTNEERQNITLQWGSNDLIVLPEQVKVDRLGADVTQSDSLRKSIETETEELNKTAGLVDQSVSKEASGEARKLAQSQFKITASIFSNAIESAENMILQLLGEETGIEYNKTFFPKSFEEEDFSQEIMQLRDILSLDFGDKNESIKRSAVDAFETKFFLED